MTRYVYSLVRCVPDPRTGEFINVGAIVGDPATGDWAMRQVSNESRVRRLASASDLEVVHGFLARVGLEIDRCRAMLDKGESPDLEESWLQALFHDHRNIVQLSAPLPVIASDSGHALSMIFGNFIIDPEGASRKDLITKFAILASIRKAYEAAHIESSYWKPRAEVQVGRHVTSRVDFAIGNGRIVQLTQGWSFQRATVDDLSTQIKAWAYAIGRLRENEDARVISPDGRESTIEAGVEVEAVIAKPTTSAQIEVFQEASQVFEELNITVRDVGDAAEVGQRAAELLRG
ncbi:DUF3037 domain-containing protein [Actinoplanes sp. NPDC051851]|uniref:DUF3037 domain-containing protein n=1 Tax=Actinoplanes sp. NPDC051851 TaxID=3154753 RepID=UPI0034372504